MLTFVNDLGIFREGVPQTPYKDGPSGLPLRRGFLLVQGPGVVPRSIPIGEATNFRAVVAVIDRPTANLAVANEPGLIHSGCSFEREFVVDEFRDACNSGVANSRWANWYRMGTKNAVLGI